MARASIGLGLTPDDAPTGLMRWSTSDVAPSQRLDYWIGTICENFVAMDLTCAQPHRIDVGLATAPLGPLKLNQGWGSALDFYRTRRGIARADEHVYYLMCKSDSTWVAAQHGAQARLLPGDLVLVDSRHCYELHFPLRCDTLSLELPAAWVERWLPAPAEQVARRIDGSSGFGAALSAYTRQMRPELSLAPPLPAELMVDQLGALLALACGSSPANRRTWSGQRERIVETIRERHAEPGLVAAQVAASLDIGERSLHRALAADGLTFAGLLAECRVGAARRLLSDARFDRLTVAEIGRRVGLADASHFVRVMRRHTGCTPGELRQQR